MTGIISPCMSRARSPMGMTPKPPSVSYTTARIGIVALISQVARLGIPR